MNEPAFDHVGSHEVARGRPDTRFDFWVAALTSASTLFTFIVAAATPPKSGPFCIEDCVGYPYTDFAEYIPRDFLWMYPAVVVTMLFVMLVGVIHERTAVDRRGFSRIGSGFALMAAALLIADYFIQLRVIQPAVLNGELDGLTPLTQYNPHGVFIALEEAGYLLMAVTFAFAGLAISGRDLLARSIRWVLVGGCALVFFLLVVFSAVYGFDVEYRLEVAIISVDWTVLIVAATLLAFLYRSREVSPNGRAVE